MKDSLIAIDISSLSRNDEYEVITITESYDLFNMVLPKDFISHFTPLSDSTEYLKDFPGFSSMRNGGTNSDIVFRGMFGSRFRILDGSGEIFGACGSRMDSSSAYIFPENFDGVRLIKGPQTVLWGPVASGGVVRFERYSPRFYTPSMNMSTSTTIGSFNRIDKNVSTVFGNSLGYFRLIGIISYSNDYLDGKRHIIPSAWNKWSTNMIFGFRPVSDILLELTLFQSNGNAKYAGRGMDAMCFARESFEIRFKKNHIYDDNLYDIDLTTWYHYINHVMVENSNIDSNINQSSESDLFSGYKYKHGVDRIISGFRAIFIYRWYDVQMHYGVDMQINQHRKKIIHDDWFKDSCFQDTGLFVELDWKLALFSKFVSGVRLEHTLVNYYLADEIKQKSVTYPAGFVRYEHVFSFPDLLSMYIGVGANKRFPDYWELVLLKSEKEIVQDSFYRVKEEKNVQLDVGASYKSDRFDVWMSSYYGYIKDFMLYRYHDAYALYNNSIYKSGSYVDNINAIIRGSEIGCNYRLNNVNLESNISYVFGKNLTKGCPLPQIPPLEGRMTLVWQYGLWTTKYTWRMVASQSRISINDGNVIAYDTDTSKGFSIFSINLLREISHEIKLGCGVNNLLNKSYSEHLNMNGNKRFKNLSGCPLHEPGRSWWLHIGVIF